MLGYIKLIILICTFSMGRAEIYAIRYDSQFFFQQYDDVPATFGPQLSNDRVVRGMLRVANPIDACIEIEKPPNDRELENWIVLIARYTDQRNCTFGEKIRIAQNANYSAAIVYNVHSEQLIPMGTGNSSGINIPSVFTAESSGLSLKQYANYDYYIVITGESSKLPYLLVPFAIVVGICLIIMIIFMIVKFIKDRRRQRRHRLPTSTLNKIPTCKYQKGDPYETCAICLDDYIEGEKLRVLPCNHAYHAKCIDPWLTKNRRVCPICKRKVLSHDEPQNDSDSDSDGGTPDDTTPLINNRSANNATQGGTFQEENENPFQRAVRSISQQSNTVNFPFTASGHHSINGEYHTCDSSLSPYYSPSSSSSTSTTCESDDNCDHTLDEVCVHTISSGAGNNDNNSGSGNSDGNIRV